MARESSHMHLIDHQLFQRESEGAIVFPVEIPRDQTASWRRDALVPLAPRRPPGNGSRRRVQQFSLAVESMPFSRCDRTFHAERILDCVRVEIKNDHRMYVTDTKFRKEGYSREWLVDTTFMKHERALRPMTGINREIDSLGKGGCAERLRYTGAQRKITVPVRRIQVNPLP